MIIKSCSVLQTAVYKSAWQKMKWKPENEQTSHPHAKQLGLRIREHFSCAPWSEWVSSPQAGEHLFLTYERRQKNSKGGGGGGVSSSPPSRLQPPLPFPALCMSHFYCTGWLGDGWVTVLHLTAAGLKWEGNGLFSLHVDLHSPAL